MSAGDYSTRLIRMVYTGTKEEEFGEVQGTFADGSSYWAMVTEKSSGEKLAFGQRNFAADVTIKIRMFPTITINDRLRDKATDQIYRITGPIVFESDGIMINAERWGESE
jgi:head-tail adaptor